MTEAALLARLKKTSKAAQQLRDLPGPKKNRVLRTAARLLASKQKSILGANRKDLEAIEAFRRSASKGDSSRNDNSKYSEAFIDRLKLTPKRLEQMKVSLHQVADLPDPVGEEADRFKLANGLRVSRLRSPLGVIFMIFESRPNVAVESFSLGFKAGNAMILRGGKESQHTTKALYKILEESLKEAGISADSLWGISDSDRNIPNFLLRQKDWIDVVVPRGGDRLIEFVTENSRIPIIKNDRGLCHVYVHADADLAMAQEIVINAKTQRPGVCNAMETLLVHHKVARKFLPRLLEKTREFNVKWHVCPVSQKALTFASPSLDLLNVQRARPQDWDVEYLDYEMNCKVVASLEEAITHIEEHGSGHSEAIISKSEKTARAFQSQVDAAAVYWNASTRFTDGFELGLGGELGISTQKIHVRGPVGLRELTSLRWVISGSGQTRKG